MLTPEMAGQWLSSMLAQYADSIERLFIFGSVARRCETPSDCDVAIVLTVSPSGQESRSIRLLKGALRTDFEKAFGLPLSLMLLTSSEFAGTLDWFEERGDPRLLVDLATGALTLDKCFAGD